MDIGDLLRRKRASVLGRWSKTIREDYPAETGRFLREREDRFANPVGHVIARTTEVLYDALIEPTSRDVLCEQMDALVRIRAVQELSPVQAVGFVFSLKAALRQELADEIRTNDGAADLLALESRIDEWALLAFDLYVKCREKLHDLRVDEVKRQTQTVLRRANRDR